VKRTRSSTRWASDWIAAFLLFALLAPAGAALAQDADRAEELARLLQNPLANIAALMTDNDVSFRVGDDHDPAFSFQLQPVYAFDFPQQGFTFIPRGIVPILGVPGGGDLLWLGDPRAPGGTTWGLGDLQTQFFFAPHMKSSWKIGAGPQISWKTRTDDAVGGPGWGAGLAGVVTGGIGENISVAVLAGNHWGFDGDFSTLFVQPMVYYNLNFLPGAYVGYNNSFGVDWKARSGDHVTLPLGLTVGRTLDIGDGYGLDLSLGAYGFAVKPDGGPDWQLKFGVTFLFPR